MVRRNKNSVSDDLFEILVELPWWAGPICIVLAFGALYWIPPLVLPIGESRNETLANSFRLIIVPVCRGLAPAVGLFVLVIWLLTLCRKWINRRRFDKQEAISTIRDLSWQEFELLLSEYFRRKGFKVQHTGSNFPDGGVDIRLHSPHERILVQCKHWRDRRVGVKPVRELMGIVASEKATSGVVVSSGEFTLDAIKFADQNPLRLINAGKHVISWPGFGGSHAEQLAYEFRIVLHVGKREQPQNSFPA